MTWLGDVSAWTWLGVGVGYVAASSVLALAVARVLGRTSDAHEFELGSARSDAAHEDAAQSAPGFETSVAADSGGFGLEGEEYQGPGRSGTRLKPVVDEATTDVDALAGFHRHR